jgi:hypothetical protein
MMDLASRHNNSYEKRDIEMGFAITCSPTHSAFLNVHENVSCECNKRMRHNVPSVVGTATAAVDLDNGECAASLGWSKANPL